MSGSGVMAMKRRIPELKEMRQMDALELQRLNSVALEETAAIERRMVRIEAGLLDVDEQSRRRTELALMRWRAVPGMVSSVFAERRLEPDPMRRLLISLYRSVQMMVEVDDSDAPEDDDRFETTYTYVRSALDHINEHLTQTGTSDDIDQAS